MEMMYQFNFKPLLLMYMASVLSCVLNFNKSELYFIRPWTRKQHVVIEELETAITVMDMIVENFTVLKVYLAIH